MALIQPQIGEGNKMSSKVLVVLEDDLDGSKASETVTLGLTARSTKSI
jgi:hypothetical protein